MSKSGKNRIVYSIVIPVYKSEQTLNQLYERILHTMKALGEPFEIIFVEDCGMDNSWQVLKAIAEKDKRVTAVQLMRNYGQANATICGLGQSKGQFIITLDDDLQNPPEEIKVLVNAINENPELDVILGAPRQKQHVFWRRLGSNFLNWTSSRLFTRNQNIKLTSFRILRRSVVNQLLSINTPRPAIGALLLTITPRIENVYVDHHPRGVGRGNYTITKILGLTLDKFLSFSTFPLRFLATLGLIGIIASTALGIFYFVRYLIGGIGVVGWITQTLLLIALSGFNFFAFGIMGEYLLRILQSTHNTPQYLIRQKVGKYESVPESMRKGNEVQEMNSIQEPGSIIISTQHDQ